MWCWEGIPQPNHFTQKLSDVYQSCVFMLISGRRNFCTTQNFDAPFSASAALKVLTKKHQFLVSSDLKIKMTNQSLKKIKIITDNCHILKLSLTNLPLII